MAGADGLATGLAALDDDLGELRPGTLVALVGGPDAPTEPVLYEASRPRPTRYLTGLRPPTEVRAALERHGVEEATVEEVTGPGLLSAPERAVSGLDARSTVVLDPVTDAEQGGREEYRAFLAALKRGLRMTESVGVLHCFETRPATLRRDLTLARADHVWRVDVLADGAVDVRLSVAKARGHPLPDHQFRLAVEADAVTAEPMDAARR
jgi:hypothetical protein